MFQATSLFINKIHIFFITEFIADILTAIQLDPI